MCRLRHVLLMGVLPIAALLAGSSAMDLGAVSRGTPMAAAYGRLLDMRVVDEQAEDASTLGAALTPEQQRVMTKPPR